MIRSLWKSDLLFLRVGLAPFWRELFDFAFIKKQKRAYNSFLTGNQGKSLSSLFLKEEEELLKRANHSHRFLQKE